MLCSVSAVKATTTVKAVESPVESTAATGAAEPKESVVSEEYRSAVRVVRNLLGRML